MDELCPVCHKRWPPGDASLGSRSANMPLLLGLFHRGLMPSRILPLGRSNLVQRILHRRIAENEPVLQPVDAQHGFRLIRRTAIARLGVVRLDQRQQPGLEAPLAPSPSEALARGLFAFAGVLGIGNAHLGHAAGLRFCLASFQ